MSMGKVTASGSGLAGGPLEPHRYRVRVAALRSLQLKLLSRTLGFDVAVLAVVDDPEGYAEWLSGRWYGAFRIRSGWMTAWDTWDTLSSTTRLDVFPFDPRWLGGMPNPEGMHVADGCLEVDLPPNGCRDAFAAGFRAGMADRQFDVVAKAPASVAWRFRTGRPVEVGPRYALPSRGSIRPVVADCIYAFHPRALRAVVWRAADALTLVGIRSALATASQSRAG